jgi:hypothetical protein
VSDRLDELRRQRSLQREHLDWIEREIAALEAAARTAPTARAAPGAEPPEIEAAVATDADRTAEAILSEYVQPAASIEQRTKLGCILYLALALALMALCIGAVYLHARAAHGH